MLYYTKYDVQRLLERESQMIDPHVNTTQTPTHVSVFLPTLILVLHVKLI